MNKRYKLLTDLPNAKAGEIFELGENGNLYSAPLKEVNHPFYTKEEIEDHGLLNPDKGWFEEVIEDSQRYFIDNFGCVCGADRNLNWNGEKEIGNYFKTKEEAEAAVKKLEAWKRLKDAGFKFINWYGGSKTITYEFKDKPEGYIPVKECADLDLLFGGEE